MQAFLRFLLFFVLLKSGASLQCEVCVSSQNSTEAQMSPNITCQGTPVTCPPNKDMCMITVAEHNLGGKTERFIEKSCAYSKVCSVNDVHLFLGKGRSYRSSIVCCKGICPKQPIAKLPVNARPNEKECPACFALAKTCKAETVKCTGNDTHCIDVTSMRKLSVDGNFEDLVIKGCTTKSLCASLKQEKIPLLLGEVEKVECNPEISRGSQPTTSFLLLTFSGLLLMKIFE
ncbi:phospholipase A2 inhibitor gamma subunit B-like [Sceloporus undulatus]|uniref:phospholipase A2 inhibitor gamma subunit B-like n=1 Tax=Sceloporus undulatus TaxID=8520 RepID=UPI001C4B5F73|nr:phospholipase A2 inhibitor gamma subunit B-like [Sceloporus undulatus]XP_042295270.1 phospholipase A2 inhibitor gamma subunit B-like [Sceloporus undulatus]XP_042295271.1 phospholipase A2 inhibitor gamma subunit B-like [Sceloporus undulatus]XP_042295272.1 phospholipase A2 inhibitor gamma subunit B-like [Sceloporus undulatus]